MHIGSLHASTLTAHQAGPTVRQLIPELPLASQPLSPEPLSPSNPLSDCRRRRCAALYRGAERPPTNQRLPRHLRHWPAETAGCSVGARCRRPIRTAAAPQHTPPLHKRSVQPLTFHKHVRHFTTQPTVHHNITRAHKLQGNTRSRALGKLTNTSDPSQRSSPQRTLVPAIHTAHEPPVSYCAEGWLSRPYRARHGAGGPTG